MKITFILPGIEITGGIKSTFELANRLQERGHNVSIVYPLIPQQNGDKWYDIKRLGFRTVGTIRNLKRRNRVAWFNLKVNLICVPYLSERWIPKGDVIIATWWKNAYDISSYGNDKGAKFYFIRHYEIWGGPKEAVIKTYRLPLQKIITSSWLKETIENKFNVETIGPIPNGLDFNIFNKKKSSFITHNPMRIGMLYRRSKWKGMKEGFEAYLIVKEKYPDLKLVLFGELPLKKDMEILKDIDEIEYYEKPCKEKLKDIYDSLDIFVFPSHCEGFGNPPMEAMACGVACVTTNVGAISDYAINGKTALVVPPKDSSILAMNVMKLLENECLRKEIAENGFKYIQQFTWDKSAEKLEYILKQNINRE